jgi:15-cis-phytoene synthase
MSRLERELLRSGSAAYFFGSAFFPAQKRDDIVKLYSFVRVIGDYIHRAPVGLADFNEAYHIWRQAQKQHPRTARPRHELNAVIVSNILYLSERYRFEPRWIRALFMTLRRDLRPRRFQTLEDTLDYVFGSAEVVGLMMARILSLPDQVQEAARLQSRAMCYVGLIRSIPQASAQGRCYFPEADLRACGLRDLSESTVRRHPEAFRRFIGLQLSRYHQWQAIAEQAMPVLPRRLRIPIKTAVRMSNWTAEQIKIDPFVIYDGNVAPTRRQILRAGLRHAVRG